MRVRTASAIWAIGACLVAGCAARPARDLTRFVRREPASEIKQRQAPAQVSDTSLEAYIAKVRDLVAKTSPPPKPQTAAAAEDWDPALASALQVLARSRTAENHRRVAERYHQLGILDAAYDQLKQALSLDPGDAAALERRARILRDWGQPSLGLGYAYLAAHYAPAWPVAHNTLGTLLQALGRRAEARAAYARAVALDPQAAYALNNVCYAALLDGDFAAATAACRQALQIDKGLDAARNNLALAHAAAGNLEAAAGELALMEDEAAGQYNVGVLYLDRRQFDKAAEAFDAAYRLRPSLVQARVRARQARQLLKQVNQHEDLEHVRN